jgi:glycosyltransferase involved in cell wall biosynthesis
MRVLLFRTLCDTGGVSTWMLLLARELRARGVECDFWFCTPSARLPEFIEAGGTTVAPLHQLVLALHQRRDYDVVHVTSSDPAGDLIGAFTGHARVVVTSHGALSEMWSARNCFAYTAVSAGMAAAAQPGTDLEVEVVRNAIESARWTPPSDPRNGPPIIAFVGRTATTQKDFPRFTRIARRLVDRGARVWVADAHDRGWDAIPGDACDRIPVERWAPVPHAEMAEFYRSVARSGGAVLMPSRFEGFPYTAVEAAACGATVVAARVVGLEEAVLPGRTGLLFDPGADDDAVADELSSWLERQPSSSACSAAAHAAFAAASMTDAYMGIYLRADQRLAPPAGESPSRRAEMATLTAHVVQQRAWRARLCTAVARELAREGHADLALRALALTWRALPRYFATRRGARHALGAAWHVARRPGRLRRSARRSPISATA